MCRHWLRFWTVAALSGGLGLGCRSAPDQVFPDAPLLISKQPVEGKFDRRPPERVADAEPVAPAAPSPALATVPGPADPPVPSQPAPEAETARGPVAAPAPRRTVPAIPASRVK